MDLKSIRKTVDGKLSEFHVRIQQHKDKQRQIKKLKLHQTSVAEAQTIVETVSRTIQEEAHNQIAPIVSQCLEIVFDEPYTFHILFEKKRNRTQARLVFERDGVAIDPMTAAGGGVIDVASFALRLSCLMLYKPKLRKVLILDEPFKFVSYEFRDNVCQMLKQLSEKLHVQIIMVTHIPELVTGKEITL